MKAQGSSEYLLILGAILIIGIAAVSFVISSAGKSGEISQLQSEAYWRSARPIGILEAYGSVIRIGNNAQDTLVIRVVNNEPYPIKILNITVNGNASEIRYGNQKSYDDWQHVVIGPFSCIGRCSINLATSESVFIQISHDSICNKPRLYGRSASANSIVKDAKAQLRVYYEKKGITQVMVPEIELKFTCLDYFLCKESYLNTCMQRYDTFSFCDEDGACVYIQN
ncbi:MAG: hypothetical protein N3E51_01260 [Candidatus Micrarchaeota archaeon]|nr:hypothetical protein [Candidatus Micrarchaeota archaeon]